LGSAPLAVGETFQKFLQGGHLCRRILLISQSLTANQHSALRHQFKGNHGIGYQPGTPSDIMRDGHPSLIPDYPIYLHR
jgi:hypothetical protein